MPIKTGKLRRKYNEALERKIICRNALLISLAYMEGSKQYSVNEKKTIAVILINYGTTVSEIERIIPQITSEYYPTSAQIARLFKVIAEDYNYEKDFIENKYLKTVKWETLEEMKTAQKKVKRRNGPALKRYIWENELVEILLEKIGCGNIQYHMRGDYWSCMNPDGDNASAINVKNNKYLGIRNWTRENEFDGDADIISLVRYSRNCSYPEAYDYICEMLGISANLSLQAYGGRKNANTESCVTRNNSKPKKEEQSRVDERILEKYIKAVPAQWFREGITPETAEKFNIHLNADKENGAIIIPIRDYQSGKMVALSVRTTIDENIRKERGVAKYRTTPKYKKHLNIYGLYENKTDILEKGYVVVYEAEKSVLKRDSSGDPTGVALQGHELSEQQAEILLSLNVDIVISMDADISIKDVFKMCERLYQRNGKNIYYTIDIHGLLGEKDSIADLKKEKFDLIFSEKVLYDEKEHKRFLSWKGK